MKKKISKITKSQKLFFENLLRLMLNHKVLIRKGGIFDFIEDMPHTDGSTGRYEIVEACGENIQLTPLLLNSKDEHDNDVTVVVDSI